jgi:hypothetical protein
MRTVFDNPRLMTRITGFLIIASILEWAAATVFGWVHSVAYVSHLSQLAITISLIPWFQGLRVEARQVEEDIPREVVERVISDTNIEPAS